MEEGGFERCNVGEGVSTRKGESGRGGSVELLPLGHRRLDGERKVGRNSLYTLVTFAGPGHASCSAGWGGGRKDAGDGMKTAGLL